MATGDRRLTVTVADTVGQSWPARLAPSRSLGPFAAGSVRRHIDIITHPRAGGTELAVLAVGHDVTVPTDADAAPRIVEQLELNIRVALPEHHIVAVAVEAVPALRRADALATLVGVSACAGFRRLATARGDELGEPPGSLLRTILYDIPIAVLLRRSVDSPLITDAPPPPGWTPPVDLCAGWVDGGALHTWASRVGPRRLGHGPPPEPIDGSDGTSMTMPPGAPQPTAGSTLRSRRIELRRQAQVTSFRSIMRDLVFERDHETTPVTVVHEYEVAATLDQATGAISHCAATPVVLPAPQCPDAAASAARLSGTTLSTAIEALDTEFTGTRTCTHLNDTLQTITAIPSLAGRLAAVDSRSAAPDRHGEIDEPHGGGDARSS